MNFFDSSRPQTNSQPAYGDPPLAVLPALQVLPRPGGRVEVRAMLAKWRGTFQWYIAERPIAEAGAIIAGYAADPEATFKDLFDYEVPRGLAPAPAPQDPKLAAKAAHAEAVAQILADLGI